MIKINSVSKSFKDKKVLNKVSMVLENGKITSLIGLNGAGKSTLISLIMNYKKKNSGTIDRKSVSVMPDAETMPEDLTGEEFLKFISGIKKLNHVEKTLYITLSEQLLIKKDLSKKIKGYSFGMKKKLSFIQTYLGDFDTYIFDEPTSGVDVESARVMMKLLNELKLKNKAILLTSHNIEELQEYSDYVYILKKGEISNHGTVEEVRKSKSEIFYTIIFKEDHNLDINHLLRDFTYSLEKSKIEIYSEDIKKINKLLTEMIQHSIQIEYFSKNTESLRNAVFETEQI